MDSSPTDRDVKPFYRNEFRPPRHLDIALACAARGWRVIPIHSSQNRPVLKDWPRQGTTDGEQLCRWFLGEFRTARVGVVTGNGLLVVDVDYPKPDRLTDGRLALAKLEAEHGSLGEPFQKKRGGPHYFYSYPPSLNIQNVVGLDDDSPLGKGIDVRADGGQVVMYAIPQGEISPAPEWLLYKVTSGENRKRPDHRAVSQAQRFTVDHPCPVCGKWETNEHGGEWGMYSADFLTAFCREPLYANGIKPSGPLSTYPHSVSGLCRCGLLHPTTRPDGDTYFPVEYSDL